MQVGESSKINGGRQDWRGNRHSRLAQETPGRTSVLQQVSIIPWHKSPLTSGPVWPKIVGDA
jgi:hypothetical protein